MNGGAGEMSGEVERNNAERSSSPTSGLASASGVIVACAADADEEHSVVPRQEDDGTPAVDGDQSLAPQDDDGEEEYGFWSR